MSILLLNKLPTHYRKRHENSVNSNTAELNLLNETGEVCRTRRP